jgi:hypothetical protein
MESAKERRISISKFDIGFIMIVSSLIAVIIAGLVI